MFVEILLVDEAMGLVKLGTNSLDGTRIKALTWNYANRLEAELEVKQAKREALEKETVKKPRGKQPKPPTSGPQAKERPGQPDGRGVTHYADRQRWL